MIVAYLRIKLDETTCSDMSADALVANLSEIVHRALEPWIDNTCESSQDSGAWVTDNHPDGIVP